MNMRKNEQGYALLIVLFLVVFIMSVSAVFMRGAISNAKQEQIVDTNNLSVVAAEMGVDYYKTALSNEYYNHIGNLVELAETEIESIKDGVPSYESIQSKLAEVLAEKLEGFIRNEPNMNEEINIDKYTGLKFNEIGLGVVTDVNQVTVEGKVLGISDNDEKGRTLNWTIIFKIPAILELEQGSPSDPNDEGEGTANIIPPPPTKPKDAVTSWPCLNKEECIETINNFMEVTDVSIKKGNVKFKDHLVVNSLRVDGGNGTDLTIAKNFYIKDKLDVQNHACIAVQGDFTAINSITSINKLYIFVYGDAYLPSTIDFNNDNNGIFVTGDVYIGGVKQVPKLLDSVPDSTPDGKCSLPGIGDNPGGDENPTPTIDDVWESPVVDVEYPQ